jgi:hypothetical protein
MRARSEARHRSPARKTTVRIRRSIGTIRDRICAIYRVIGAHALKQLVGAAIRRGLLGAKKLYAVASN